MGEIWDGIDYALDARYIREDGVLAMVIAAFCLGLIIGALVMDRGNATEKPRPAAVRPPAPVKQAPRHRAPSREPMTPEQQLTAIALAPKTEEIPAVSPTTRLDVRL